jgi:hypothetical protein
MKFYEDFFTETESCCKCDEDTCDVGGCVTCDD